MMKGREKELDFFLTGSLEKVFPDQRPEAWKEGEKLCILKGETPALQLVYYRKPGGAYPGPSEVSLRGNGGSSSGQAAGSGAGALRISLL